MRAEDAREFDYAQQNGGDVYVVCAPEDAIVVPAHSTMVLLQIVLTAIRVEGDHEKIELAKKVVMGALGR